MGPRGQVCMEGMFGYIERGAFADLGLGRRGQDHFNFEVLRPMERLRNEMKRTAGFVSSNGNMVIVIELTTEVRRKNSMNCPPMQMICCSMAMVSLRMDVN